MSLVRGFPDDSAGKEPTYRGDTGDTGSIPGSGKSLEVEENKKSQWDIFSKQKQD